MCSNPLEEIAGVGSEDCLLACVWGAPRGGPWEGPREAAVESRGWREGFILQYMALEPLIARRQLVSYIQRGKESTLPRAGIWPPTKNVVEMLLLFSTQK